MGYCCCHMGGLMCYIGYLDILYNFLNIPDIYRNILQSSDNDLYNNNV